MMQPRHTKPYIDGKYVTPSGGESYEAVNPATGKPICRVEACAIGDIDRAVEAAARAQKEWKTLHSEKRSEITRRIAQGIRSRAGELAELESMNMGMPLSNAKAHFVPRSALLFEYFGGMADKAVGKVVPISPNHLSMNILEPYGVVGILLPWNAPLAEFCLAVSAAIACGNTVVVKPAFETPLTALAMGEVFDEAGLPAGVVNIVTGRGRVIGDHMAKRPGIRKLIFTGSYAVGCKLLENTAESLKSVSLELGGKTPVIVMEDADFDLAVREVAYSACRNSGQVCTAASRVYVHRSIAGPYIDAVVKRMASFRFGDPMDPGTDMGPVVSRAHRDGILEYIEEGKRSGAKVLLEGGLPADPKLQDGFYVLPAAFTGLPHDSRLVQEEIFGPVLLFFVYDDLGEALALANDSKYGLGSAVFTRDIQKANRCIRELDDGIVWVNCLNMSHPAITTGGVKQSGLGLTNGMETVLQTYSRTKTVWVNTQ